jgi:hypothetical protein
MVGRLSDVVDRKYMATIPPIVAFAGAVISAKATSMDMLSEFPCKLESE